MSLIPNAEIWYSRLDPKRPNRTFNKENPTWDLQIRTIDKKQKAEWEALGLPVKPIIPDEGPPFYKVTLRKKIIKRDGTDAMPVGVVDGKGMPLDPKSIGNGSIGNIKVFQYQYPNQDGAGTKTASILMDVQVTLHKVYVPKPRADDFKEAETTTVMPDDYTPPVTEEDVPF